VGGNIYPSTDNTYDIGDSTNQWANIWLSQEAYANSIAFRGVNPVIDLRYGGTNATFIGILLPKTTNIYNIGDTTLQWGSMWLAGDANIGGNAKVAGTVTAPIITTGSNFVVNQSAGSAPVTGDVLSWNGSSYVATHPASVGSAIANGSAGNPAGTIGLIPSDTGDFYNPFSENGSYSTSPTDIGHNTVGVANQSETISNLVVAINSSPGTTVTFTIIDNTTGGTLSATVSSSGTTAVSTGSLNVSAGDLITMEIKDGNGTALVNTAAVWSFSY
jgi:hypothetical protein